MTILDECQCPLQLNSKGMPSLNTFRPRPETIDEVSAAESNCDPSRK